jgi:hypothetical protein
MLLLSFTPLVTLTIGVAITGLLLSLISLTVQVLSFSLGLTFHLLGLVGCAVEWCVDKCSEEDAELMYPLEHLNAY